MSAPGRPKGEYRNAQHEGTPMSAKEGPREVGIAARLLQCWRQREGAVTNDCSEPAA